MAFEQRALPGLFQFIGDHFLAHLLHGDLRVPAESLDSSRLNTRTSWRRLARRLVEWASQVGRGSSFGEKQRQTSATWRRSMSKKIHVIAPIARADPCIDPYVVGANNGHIHALAGSGSATVRMKSA